MFLGRLTTVIGWICVAFFGIALAGGFIQQAEGKPFETYIFVILLLLIAFGFRLVRLGSKRRKLFGNYKLYTHFTNTCAIHSVEELADAVGQSIAQVEENLRLMLKSHLFVEFEPADEADEETSYQAAPARNPEEKRQARKVSVICSGCGAANVVIQGESASCEYCGSQL